MAALLAKVHQRPGKMPGSIALRPVVSPYGPHAQSAEYHERSSPRAVATVDVEPKTVVDPPTPHARAL